PFGTIGRNSIDEYDLSPAVTAIKINTIPAIDPYGDFLTIPTINGYTYDYSIMLGSTAVTPSSSIKGGYVRGISYKIKVPAGATSIPYTVTYAYAMVLENGSHDSNEQPLFSTIVKTNDSIINCASPAYFLPTFSTENGKNAQLDTVSALAKGFLLSEKPSPNFDSKSNSYLKDIWTKDWTEVTFDLSPYRGKEVTMTFETDNCVPGGHFAYSYIALRNKCGDIIISGDSVVCSNDGNLTYSIPLLTDGQYQWVVPDSWTITSDKNSNIINVTAGDQSGLIQVNQFNKCTSLQTQLKVTAIESSIGGILPGTTHICTGNNTTTLQLTDKRGDVLKWLSSLNGRQWNEIVYTDTNYTVQNLTVTTLYKAIVKTHAVCAADTSSTAAVIVDEKSQGGKLNPAGISYYSKKWCLSGGY
ncbi:MAG: hypothetical protein HY305_04150, partial [Sphingobacteriales bacterium]|nr:hypothetical protein [Sphingobacteriales bacterium]